MLVRDPDNIRLAMVGMVEGNGHPYSWTAILNGRYRAEDMERCGYPAILQYLNAQPKDKLGIRGVQVTHIWCDNRNDAVSVAKATYIPNVVASPTDVIGQVDAVIIPTDKPEEHLERAAPFIEAGLPVFIDKPLTNDLDHLRRFAQWQRAGKPILSTSCMRYGVEFAEARRNLDEIGALRLLTMTMCKSWERYGIHALEGVYPFLAPGDWLTASHRGDADRNIVHLTHAAGVDLVITQIADLYGAFGCLGISGTKGHRTARFMDTFTAFKTQLIAGVDWLRTGRLPVAFDETEELMRLVIAVQRSRDEGGRAVPLREIEI